jgi:hypothetical protein
MPSTQATYDDANLILRLYELRRDEKMRTARNWFAGNFKPANLEEMQKIAPPGSEQNAYVRMVTSYWEMAASFITSGVLNADLFFQAAGEMLFVWERVKPVVSEMRTFMKSPQIWRNLETVGAQYAKYMESQGPESYQAFQAMVRGVGAADAAKS